MVSTVNIQHLESLADAVEQITGVQIRERVPDWVVRKADQVELIDSSSDQLRRRMLHGNIYPAEKVPDALSGFFKVQNLVALRELALRFVADGTDEELSCATSPPNSPGWCGTRPNASWWPSPEPPGATASCAGRPGWREG